MDIQFNYTYTAGDLATLYCRIKDLGTKVVSTTTTTTTTNTTIPKNNDNNYSIIIPKNISNRDTRTHSNTPLTE